MRNGIDIAAWLLAVHRAHQHSIEHVIYKRGMGGEGQEQNYAGISPKKKNSTTCELLAMYRLMDDFVQRDA